MILIQYRLKKVNSETYKICWLDKSVEVGSKITLKGENCWFKVIEKYGKIDYSILELNKSIPWYALSKHINPAGKRELVIR